MKDIIHAIYKIENIINNNIYIGSAVNIKTRWWNHVSELRGGRHRNKHLQRAWNKHGEDNFIFSILEICDIEKLIELEQFYIDTLRPQYNICLTASSQLGIKRTLEQRERMRNSQLGKKLSQEHKDRIAASMRGTVHSQETRDKISASNLGKKYKSRDKK